jgi:RNA polymerase sigma factor (sigma-70 family)
MTPVLWHVVRAYRLSTEVAEDVVQTTWLALVRSRDSIHEPAAIGGWLTTSARREAWKVAKASGRGIPVEDDELARRLPDEGSAEAEVVRRDGEAQLWDAVDRLSERCQALLRIVAFEHRPDYTKIAADLDMPVGSIGPTRGRCLQKLRALIESGDDDA